MNCRPSAVGFKNLTPRLGTGNLPTMFRAGRLDALAEAALDDLRAGCLKEL